MVIKPSNYGISNNLQSKNYLKVNTAEEKQSDDSEHADSEIEDSDTETSQSQEMKPVKRANVLHFSNSLFIYIFCY